MRTVLKNIAEVCEVWATQSQNEGRCGNIHFDHDTIFSYGHWPMARFIKPDIVLFRNYGNSMTIIRQQQEVFAALRRRRSEVKIYHVLTMYDHTENVLSYQRSVRNAADAFWQYRSEPEYLLDSYNALVLEARQYVDEFIPDYELPALFGLELSGPRVAEKLQK
jgi:hypothetical protein